MKINILLPYKEEYDCNNSGAVSIFVKNNFKYSKLKKKIYIFGTKTKSKEKNFIHLPKSKYLKNYSYVRSFSKILKKNKSIIEIHNRPRYFNYLKKKLPNNNYILYFHNNPLELSGSKSLKEREYIIRNCNYLVFISDWIKKKFFLGLNDKEFSNYKVIYHSLKKSKKIPLKKKIIFFCGKLNRAKGYDLFCEATKKFLKSNPDWKILSAGTEPRRDIKIYDHVKELGQIDHGSILKIIKHSKITVAPSIWDEPLGRLPIESAALGSVCISSSNGGLTESNKFGLVIDDINIKKIFNTLLILSNYKNYKQIQKRIFNNTYIDNVEETKKIDFLRSAFIVNKNKLKKNLKILHISNFNDNVNARLFYSTQRKLNFGFAKLNHNILPFDERLFLRNSIHPLKNRRLNNKIIEITKNFLPDLVILGHSDSIEKKTLIRLKEINPNIKIVRIYLDSISKEFFNQNSEILLNNIHYIDHIFITSKPNQYLNKFKSKISYLPNFSDKSIEYLKNFNNQNYKYDLFFALSHGQNRGVFKFGTIDERDEFISKLNAKTNFLKKYFIATNFNKPVWGIEYYNLLSKSKMALNLSRGSYQKFYSSDRISSLFGNGLLVFLDKKTNFDKFFTNNKEAIFFSNLNDLVKKLKYYNSKISECRKIAKNGYLKFHKIFSSEEICNYILKKTGLKKINKKYFWESI